MLSKIIQLLRTLGDVLRHDMCSKMSFCAKFPEIQDAGARAVALEIARSPVSSAKTGEDRSAKALVSNARRNSECWYRGLDFSLRIFRHFFRQMCFFPSREGSGHLADR